MSYSDSSKTQVQRIHDHLMAGKTITPGHALLVYGISRLAVAIDSLRLSGMDIDMVLKSDESGKRYGEYKLRSPIKLGSRVQVKRGHGWSLPQWVLKTASSKVVGLVKDVAYVEFVKNDSNFEILPMNVKELSNVA